MTKTIRPAIFIGSVLAAMLVTALALFTLVPSTSSANPTAFPPTAQTATATSTVTAYQTPGTATSTVVYDAYGISGTNEASTGNTAAADSAVLLLQFAASSTASIESVDIQYSQDGIDYYAASLGWDVEEGVASSSINIGLVQQYVFTFASSTINRVAVTNANSATSTRIIRVKTPTRFVRAVLSISGANGVIWAQWVPKKERQ